MPGSIGLGAIAGALVLGGNVALDPITPTVDLGVEYGIVPPKGRNVAVVVLSMIDPATPERIFERWSEVLKWSSRAQGKRFG